MTMRDRYLALTAETPITEEHLIDYAHCEACWQSDPDVLSPWEMRYLHELEALLTPVQRADALARHTPAAPPWIELRPSLPETDPPACAPEVPPAPRH